MRYRPRRGETGWAGRAHCPATREDELMIEARGLTKRYGDTLAVDHLSFSVEPGRITGFLGPNGAGKTTTMRLILGLDRPTDGMVTVNGKAFGQLARPMREVGALLDAKAVHGGWSAYNHLLCLAQTNNLPRRRVDEVLELVGLSEVAKKRSRGFSLGMGQRLGIAGALLGDPAILMFDEPVNGLDPEGILWIRNLMKALAAEGRTVFVSSHLMSEMEHTAEHLIVIGRGQLIADCTVAEFIAQNSTETVRIRTPQQDVLAAAVAAAGGTVHDDGSGTLVVHGLTAGRVGDLAFDNAVRLHELAPAQASLEEAFMGLNAASLAGTRDGAAVAARAHEQAVATSLFGLLIGQLVIVVLGALTITSEYSTGMIAASLTTMPRRGTVFAAKAIVFGVVALVVGLITSFGSFFVGQAILSTQHVGTVLGQPGVLRAVIGGGLFLTVCGLLSFGIGALLRHTAGAITASIGLTFVLYMLSGFLPDNWAVHIDKWIPFNAGAAIWEQLSGRDMFHPWTGFAGFCGYAAIAIAGGLILFRRRDA